MLACAAALSTAPAPDVEAQSAYEAEFTAGGALIRPEGWRRWVYIGTPLTPNALNDGEASFPEFHSVYIDPVSYEHYAKTGEFREGTLIAKELSLVLSEDANEDGSTDQVSGRGYFMGEFSGLVITYKSKAHFPTNPATGPISASATCPRATTRLRVNGGGIMLHARRPGGPVAAAQNCATHGPLSVATRGRRCTAWSSMRRFDWRLSTRV